MTPHVPTVFVVDDDPSVRGALERLLTWAELRVETFAGAADLLARSPAGPGCILLDIKMPVMSGRELRQKLVAAGITLPVIFLSAHADVRIAVELMKEGALEVLTKPFQISTLLDAVRRAIAVDEVRRRDQGEYEELRRHFESLTPREKTVMTHVVAGLLNKQIAGLIGTSEKTVKVHRARVMAKMHASSLAALVRMADRLRVAPN
jgi:FixJ family two-component response regulator